MHRKVNQIVIFTLAILKYWHIFQFVTCSKPILFSACREHRARTKGEECQRNSGYGDGGAGGGGAGADK